MTEKEWLECTDPRRMLAFLHGPEGLEPEAVPGQWRKYLNRSWEAGTFRATPRKLLLFTAVCAERLLRVHPDRDTRDVVRPVAQRMAALADEAERSGDTGEAGNHRRLTPFYAAYDTVYNLALDLDGPYGPGAGPELAEQCRVLRELFGNPVRPVAVDPAWLCWNGGTIPKLARAIYEELAFDRLPVLADAVEEAGCSTQEILKHLRGEGPHFRGCWAVDLLLGQE